VSRRRWLASLVLIVALGTTAIAASANVRAVPARQASACANNYSAKRVPGNPLDISVGGTVSPAPGSNPLSGASFFVAGPRHGAAAGAIGQLLGINTAGDADSVSWARFEGQVTNALRSHPGVAGQVHDLEKIASEPEPQKFSVFSGGGSPSAIAKQVQKILCYNLAADPGTVPVITTYFLHGRLKGCPTTGDINAYMPLFKSEINAMVGAVGNQPAMWLIEEDGLGSSTCIAKNGALGAWEAALRYEVTKIASLPHEVAYLEAGYSDAQGPAYTAKALNAAGVSKIRGFWTNDTHLNWTINEIAWGNKISKLTHGAHFVVNTAQNGNGPLKNPHPGSQGVEDLCNPPGRALGPKPTTSTGFAQVDAFVWSTVPGNSAGCGGGPPGGVFWPARAESLAAHANDRIGPHYPSKPY
jgi:endoglucanase